MTVVCTKINLGWKGLRDTDEFKNVYRPIINFVKDEKGELPSDSYSILNR